MTGWRKERERHLEADLVAAKGHVIRHGENVCCNAHRITSSAEGQRGGFVDIKRGSFRRINRLLGSSRLKKVDPGTQRERIRA